MLKKKVNKRHVMQTGKLAWSLARTFLLFILSFVILFPLLQTISRAFMPFREYFDPSVVWIPKALTLTNIRAAMDTMNFWKTLGHTAILCIGCAILQVTSSAYIGYGFARFRFRLRGPLFALVILTIVVPTNLIYIPMMMQYRFFDFFGLEPVLSWVVSLFGAELKTNLLGSYWTFFLPSALGVGVRSGLFIYIFRQFFRNVPKELEEAAKIDGCGPWRTFLSIMLPNAGNSAITVFLFSIVWHWNETMMSNSFFPSNKTLAVAVNNVASSIDAAIESGYYETFGANWASAQGMRYGALILFIVPVLLLYIIAQRYFIEGVESSGIKG